MKLQFKHQKFQADAAKAVVDVFTGQPYLTPTYMMDRGYGQQTLTDDTDFTGWRNERIVPELSDKLILEHLQKVQRMIPQTNAILRPIWIPIRMLRFM